MIRKLDQAVKQLNSINRFSNRNSKVRDTNSREERNKVYLFSFIYIYFIDFKEIERRSTEQTTVVSIVNEYKNEEDIESINANKEGEDTNIKITKG